MTRRKRRRRRPFGRLIFLLALGFAGVLAWHWLQSSGWLSTDSAETQVEESRAAPPAAAPHGEDFSASERDALQDVLKRKGAAER